LETSQDNPLIDPFTPRIKVGMAATKQPVRKNAASKQRPICLLAVCFYLFCQKHFSEAKDASAREEVKKQNSNRLIMI
jgi:hypothetical protein